MTDAVCTGGARRDLICSTADPAPNLLTIDSSSDQTSSTAETVVETAEAAEASEAVDAAEAVGISFLRFPLQRFDNDFSFDLRFLLPPFL